MSIKRTGVHTAVEELSCQYRGDTDQIRAADSDTSSVQQEVSDSDSGHSLQPVTTEAVVNDAFYPLRTCVYVNYKCTFKILCRQVQAHSI